MITLMQIMLFFLLLGLVVFVADWLVGDDFYL